jgi:hypothetical protein
LESGAAGAGGSVFVPLIVLVLVSVAIASFVSVGGCQERRVPVRRIPGPALLDFFPCIVRLWSDLQFLGNKVRHGKVEKDRPSTDHRRQQQFSICRARDSHCPAHHRHGGGRILASTWQPQDPMIAFFSADESKNNWRSIA